MNKNHTATGKPRTSDEVKAEIAEREQSIKNLQKDMVPLWAESPMWLAKKTSIDKHTSIIAVLRWVLGEDLLWE
jgi:hypothetical protein